MNKLIRKELVASLYANMPVAMLASAVNSILLFIIFRHAIPRETLCYWFGCNVLVIISRYALYFRYKKAAKPDKEKPLWEHYFMATLFLTGSVFGSAGIFLYDQNSLMNQVFLTFVIGGMVTGSVGAYSIYLRAFFVYSTPAILFLPARFIMQGDREHLSMAVMVLMFYSIMMYSARRMSVTAATSLDLRFENREILEKLKSEIIEHAQAEDALRIAGEDLESQVKERTADLRRELEERKIAEDELKRAQAKIVQQEKMASIGQLSAGIAHEINNPTGYILSNLSTMQNYLGKLLDYINAQTEALASVPAGEGLAVMRKKMKIDYITKDIKDLLRESLEGAERIKEIVHNLKSFSRMDEAEYKAASLNECLEQTIKIIWNELKYKARLTKHYGELPLIKCYPQQLNQVFMNLLLNAVQAIDKQGEITITTGEREGSVFVVIQDTGCGIPEEKLHRIFEPFFTTKEVGKGTGLGLSISYDIIKHHNGEISVESEVGKGTGFTVVIPIV